MGPKVRNFILMASRQTGKCHLNSKLELQDAEYQSFDELINLLYYQHKKNLTFLEKIKFKLMQLYSKIDKW